MTQKQNEKVLARTLYFETNQSQSEIAATLNINPKTLYLWMQEGEWQRLKKAARQAPAIIVDNLYEQLTELNNNILSRPAGSRFPTREEAEISRKLVLSIDKVKKQATLSDNIQVMKSFTSYLNSINPDLAKQVTLIADDFIKGKAQDSYQPFDMAYEYDKNDSAGHNNIEVSQSVAAMPEEVPIVQPALMHGTAEENTEMPQQEERQQPRKYREGVEEIYNPDLSPWYSKELRVGNITIRFGKDLNPPGLTGS